MAVAIAAIAAIIAFVFYKRRGSNAAKPQDAAALGSLPSAAYTPGPPSGALQPLTSLTGSAPAPAADASGPLAAGGVGNTSGHTSVGVYRI